MNNVTLCGRLGKDAEQKAGDDGRQYYTLSIAESRRRRLPDGTYSDETQWWDVSSPGETRPWMRKGAIAMVYGDCSAQFYVRRDGSSGISLRVRASHVIYVAPAPNQVQAASGSTPSAPAQQSPTASITQDDDLPF